ncbi:MAG TPA: GYDIA family GHMP kinase [Saprospiraceae bacterium]|nr:GYDIA family GHMP kinase [Saprospiraceae bacterium]
MSEAYHYYAHGKLLLSAEYFILNGATGLAVPSAYGQHLRVQPSPDCRHIHWQSYDHREQCWFEGQFSTTDFGIVEATDEATAERLVQIFRALVHLSKNKAFISRPRLFQTQLEFPRDWGLGSSSTLLAALADWAEVDPYALLDQTFGGSGYDLACAGSERALLYQRRAGRGHAIHVPFAPPFREKLHFVHLNRKQNSREGIRRFREKVELDTADNDYLSRLSFQLLSAGELVTFQRLIDQHEAFIAEKLGLAKVKERYFADFPGSIKSLGAWGGDFVLVASGEPSARVRAYFGECGMETVLSYEEMVLQGRQGG